MCSIVSYMYDYAKRIIRFEREGVKLADQNIVLQGPVQDSICPGPFVTRTVVPLVLHHSHNA